MFIFEILVWIKLPWGILLSYRKIMKILPIFFLKNNLSCGHYYPPPPWDIKFFKVNKRHEINGLLFYDITWLAGTKQAPSQWHN